MKYLIFAAVIGLGLATPSFAQQSGSNPMDKGGAAASSMPSSGAMQQKSSHPMRHMRHARAGAPASRAQNEAEQRETAQLNQQQVQQATHTR